MTCMHTNSILHIPEEKKSLTAVSRTGKKNHFAYLKLIEIILSTALLYPNLSIVSPTLP